ncbi:hypothetical protein [Tepidiforma sp.]|uniref:hypothetical protein n=1 Tax=Tepidiforma sp. TaxID=2682230 RepID=UPI002ADD3CBA|nr:hypothetical protein [Tepidiforma sp.]
MSTRDRWFAAAVLGGLAAVLVSAVIALGWGRKNVSPPDLTETPNPAIPGQVLYVDADSCLILADASGAARRQVACTGVVPAGVYLPDAATVAYLDPRPSPGRLVVLNAADGSQLDVRTVAETAFPGVPTAPDGTEAYARSDGRVQLLRDGKELAVLAFDDVEWGPRPLGWSPDSQWLVLAYDHPRKSATELWIVSRDGTVRGTIANDASGAGIAWRIEGVGTWPPVP